MNDSSEEEGSGSSSEEEESSFMDLSNLQVDDVDRLRYQLFNKLGGKYFG